MELLVLPEEILSHIFSCCSVVSLMRLRCACYALKKMVDSYISLLPCAAHEVREQCRGTARDGEYRLAVKTFR